jgi:hypothetical protein
MSAKHSSGGGMLGTALMAGGAGLLVLVALWQLSFVASGTQRFSTVIFVMAITAVICAPLIGGGWYLRTKGRQEALDTGIYVERRAVLDADAALRRQLVRDIEQQLGDLRRAAGSLSGAGRESAQRAQRILTDVREDLARPGYSAATWLESAAGLGAQQLADVRRYDDLVAAQVRRIGDLSARLDDNDTATALTESATELAERVREREALLGRGRQAAALSPQELLTAGASARRRVESPVELGLEDAVSYDGEDYVVRATLSYFGGGRRWKVYQLLDGKNERWLDVRPGETDLLFLERIVAGQAGYDAPPSSRDDASLSYEGEQYTREERGSATVDIASAAGEQHGVLVDYQRFRTAANDVLVLEQWPDGPRALLGRSVAREDLDLWTKPPATQ